MFMWSFGVIKRHFLLALSCGLGAWPPWAVAGGALLALTEETFSSGASGSSGGKQSSCKERERVQFCFNLKIQRPIITGYFVSVIGCFWGVWWPISFLGILLYPRFRKSRTCGGVLFFIVNLAPGCADVCGRVLCGGWPSTCSDPAELRTWNSVLELGRFRPETFGKNDSVHRPLPGDLVEHDLLMGTCICLR